MSGTFKVFISWSGIRSQRVARGLYDLIRGVLQGVEPIISSEDLRSGDYWPTFLESYLAEAVFGIICLTEENKRSPWLCYEAGALSKSLTTKVCPYLVATVLSAEHPLSRFNYRRANETDTHALLRDINGVLPDSARTTPEVLVNAFTGRWPEFAKILAIAEADSDGTGRILSAAQQIRDAADHLECRSDLFTDLVSWSLDRVVAQGGTWPSGSMDLSDTEVIGKGIEVFNRLRKGGFATFLVRINHFWATSDEYFETCRRRPSDLGRDTITRVFILEDHVGLFNSSLREHIAKDNLAGINVRVCFSSDIPATSCKDFGIWDDELLCLIQVSPRFQLKGCTFTRDPDALKIARTWRDGIIAKSEPASELVNRFDPHASEGPGFLAFTSDDMVQHADRHCRPRQSYVDPAGSCRWYHAAWQYLRLVGAVSTPDWHADFYRKALGDAFASGGRRLLISGTADYAMLHQVARAIPDSLKQAIEIHVLDLCPTPLHICEVYENQFLRADDGWQRVRHLSGVDILKNGLKEGSFDVITTDAFLTRFRPDEQRAVVRAWHRLLSPSGRVVTTVRLSTTDQTPIAATPEQRRSFVDRVRALVRESNSELRILRPKESEIVALADGYASKMLSFRVGTEDDIRKLFGPQFELEIGVTDTLGEFQTRTEYAEIVARKTEA